MKKAVLPWDFSPYRLLPLLLVIVLSVIGVNAVHGSSRRKQFAFPYGIPAQQSAGRYEEEYQLISRCREYVQMKGRRKLRATGRKDSKFTHLMFGSQPNGLVSIRGINRHQYICFSRKGKLTLRNRETSHCVFRQVLVGGYTEFRSVQNPFWYIGFNKRGKPIRGHNTAKRKKRECLQFIMKPVNKVVQTNYSPFSFKNSMKKKAKMKRRKG